MAAFPDALRRRNRSSSRSPACASDSASSASLAAIRACSSTPRRGSASRAARTRWPTDAAAVARVQAAALKHGVLVDAGPIALPLPLPDASFDLALVDDREPRAGAHQHIGRVARGRAPRAAAGRTNHPRGAGTVAARSPACSASRRSRPTSRPLLRSLLDAGFIAARLLAAREGVGFVEAARPTKVVSGLRLRLPPFWPLPVSLPCPGRTTARAELRRVRRKQRVFLLPFQPLAVRFARPAAWAALLPLRGRAPVPGSSRGLHGGRDRARRGRDRSRSARAHRGGSHCDAVPPTAASLSSDTLKPCVRAVPSPRACRSPWRPRRGVIQRFSAPAARRRQHGTGPVCDLDARARWHGCRRHDRHHAGVGTAGADRIRGPLRRRSCGSSILRCRDPAAAAGAAG